METKDLRVKNLILLINEEDSASGFAKKHNLDPTYISQLIKGHRSFGERSARNFEEKIGLPMGWFDKEHLSDTEITAPLSDSFVVQIPVIGTLDGNPKSTSAVLKKTLESVDLTTDNARLLEAVDASMSPTINKGSTVMVDISDVIPKEGNIYLIQDGEHLMLKRLIYEYSYLVLDSVWVMKSDNPNKREYPDKFLPQASRAKVLGRVLWYENRLKH